MPIYAMVCVCMRMILAWYSPHKGKVPTLGFPVHRVIRQYGQNVLNYLVEHAYITIQEGRCIPTRGSREAFTEEGPTQLVGAKSPEELEKDIDRRLDRQFRTRLAAINLFS